MWYIKTRCTRHVLRPSYSSFFCAAWVAAVPPPPLLAKPLHRLFFFLALVHHRGDGYGCSGSGTFRASWHLEGIKLFQVQVQFSWQDLNPLMLHPPATLISQLPPSVTYALASGCQWLRWQEGMNALHQLVIYVPSSVSRFKGLRRDQFHSGRVFLFVIRPQQH